MIRRGGVRAVAGAAALTAAAAVACLALSGPVSAASPDEVQRISLESGGIQRRAMVALSPVPRAADAPPPPALVVFHDRLSTPGRMRALDGFDRIGALRQAGWTLVHPQGFKREWNAGRRLVDGREALIADDVTFLRDLVALLAAEGAADPARIFLAGFGEGGIAASPDGGILYFINRTSFGRMNLETGEAEMVYDNRNGLDSSGLTFDGDGRLLVLYHNGFLSRLSEIDPATGNTVRIIATVDIPRSLPSVGGLAFDSDSGRLFATVNSTLFDLTDPANPVAVGDMGIDRVSGLAYVPQGNPCPADLAEPFGLLDLADITAFATGFLAMGPVADLVADGLFDLSDINAFVTAFTAGCP